MTPEQIHQFLIRTKGYKLDLKERIEKMEEIRSLAEKVTPSYDFDTVRSHKGSYSRVEHYAIELVSMQESITEFASKLLDFISITSRMIELMQDPLARAVLTDFYLVGMTAHDTAVDLDYSVNIVFSYLSKANKEIAESLTPSLYASIYNAAPDIVLQTGKQINYNGRKISINS